MAMFWSEVGQSVSTPIARPQDARVAARVDEPPRLHRLPVVEGERDDPVALADDGAHRAGLAHGAARPRRVVEEDLVVDRAVHLEGGAAALPRVGRGANLRLQVAAGKEVEVPEPLLAAPAVGRADLDGEARRLDLVPDAHFVEHLADDGQLAFPDVVAREGLALEQGDLQARAVLSEQGSDGAARRPAAHDRDVDPQGATSSSPTASQARRPWPTHRWRASAPGPALAGPGRPS